MGSQSHLVHERPSPYGWAIRNVIRKALVLAEHGKGRRHSWGRLFPWFRWLLVATFLLLGSAAPASNSEAQQVVNIMSVNATFLDAHWGDLVDLKWDLLLVQEARINKGSHRCWQMWMADKAWRACA